MNSVSEILKEARKEKGLTISEVSEAIKVRTNYIEAMENGSFDYNLPEIYKKGFLKLYCNFLRLDYSDILRDYNAWKLGREPKKSSESHVARIDLQKEDSEEYRDFEDEEKSISPKPYAYAKTNSTLYLKLSAIVVGIAIIAIIALISFSSEKKSDQNNAQIVNSEASQTSTTSTAAVQETPYVLTVKASSPVQVLIKNNNKDVFKGAMANSQTEKFRLTGDTSVACTDISKLSLFKDDKKIEFSGSGTKKIEIKAN